MLGDRQRGLETLRILFLAVALPVLFLAVLYIRVEVVGSTDWSMFNIELYLAGTVLAVFFGRTVSSGSESEIAGFSLVDAGKRTNRDTATLALILFGIVFATKDKAISRLFLGWFLVSAWFLIFFSRRYLPDIILRTFLKGSSEFRTLVVGSSVAIAKAFPNTNAVVRTGFKVAGYAEVDNQDTKGLVPATVLERLGHYAELHSILNSHEIEQIVLMDSQQSSSFVQFVTDVCEATGTRLLLFNQWQRFFGAALQPVFQQNQIYFAMRPEPLANPLNQIVKRITDLVVSIPTCLIILPVLAVVVWIGQRFQSPGPLFILQERTGYRKGRFKIIKFRTMHVNDSEADQATVGDSRIYPFGAFLRKYSLDEIPQFLNVLTGSMSVVGPRPHLVAHDERFKKLVGVYRARHWVKPGITGLAQVNGFRGEVMTQEDIRERIRFDLAYIFSWSIWLDIGIMLRTFRQIMTPPSNAR